MFDLQGHRFARGLHPENTLEGLDAAVALGLHSFEIDIAVTRDGIPVLHHDPALNPDTTRGPDGNWITGPGPLIKDLTWAELGRYDVGRLRPGSTYAGLYPAQDPVDGARVPTLAAALTRHPGLRFNIELKLLPTHPDWTVAPERMVELVLRAVDDAAAADRVTLQSFDWRAPRWVRRTRPELRTGWLTVGSTDDALWRGVPAGTSPPQVIASLGGQSWTPFHTELTPELLATAHGLGLAVVPWTVNDPADMRRLIGWGVDGLITDFPDRAQPLLPAG